MPRAPGPPKLMSPLDEAIALHQRGKLNPARKIYREVVARQPNNSNALELLGLAAAELGDFPEAARVLGRAATVTPGSVNVHFNLGMAQKKLLKMSEAEASFRQVLEIQPSHALAHQQLGQVLNYLGRMAEAADCFRAAIQHNSRFADAYFNLGKLQVVFGDLYAAVASFGQAAALEPKSIEALSEQAVALLSLNRFEKATEVLQGALAIEPKSVAALVLLGSAYRLQGRYLEAMDVLHRAVAIDRDQANALFELIAAKRMVVDWSGLQHLEQAAARLVRRSESATTSMHVLALLDDPIAHRKAARSYVRARYPGAEAPARYPAVVSPDTPVLRARSEGPLRVGYFSSDFGSHPVSFAIAGFIAAHDRRRVEAHAFHLIADDLKKVRPKFVASFDHWHAMGDKSASDIVAHARALGIDIAVDLNGHTAGGRTAAFVQRLAPVQVNYLGFPCTMGAHELDYLLADSFVIPPGTDHLYDEKIVRLPGCYLPNDLAREELDGSPARAANGLPEQGLVFAAFNTINKISPDLFGCWMRLLAATPGSVLWFTSAAAPVQANLRREAEARGVGGARLVFGPFVEGRSAHLARHALADLFLDCVPYNAHTTAADALRAGLPLLTIAGAAFPSRVAGSLLTVAGLPELITTSLAEYEATALRLARDPAALAALRGRLIDARIGTDLFDARRFARRMEWAFARMAEISASGGAPAAFDVPAGA